MNGAEDDLLARVAAELNAWSSVEIRMTQTFPGNAATDRAVQRVEESYREREDGRRSLDRKIFYGDGNGFHETGFFDGAKSYYVKYEPSAWETRQRSITIGASFLHEGPGQDERPWPLRSFYAGTIPIHEVLKGTTDARLVAPLGRPCATFAADRLPWSKSVQDLVYLIDEQDHVPLRIVSYVDQAAKAADRPVWDWSALRIDHIQGHAVVVDSETLRYHARDGSLLHQTRFQVNHIVFDPKFADTDFKPVFEPGITVFDTLTKREYTTPVVGGRLKKEEAKPAIVAGAKPVTAEPPSAGSSILSISLFSLGAALLLAATLIVIVRRFGR